jgi:prepilin-type N-terminal cleavage/methylation domain-containing protein
MKPVSKNNRGFTLMELLVVLGIFSMVVTSASDIFLLTGKSQRKIFGLERTQADARFTMEAIAREVRTGTFDWAYYAGRTLPLGLPDNELALVDSTQTALRFSMSDSNTNALCPDAASTPCLLVTVGTNTPTPLTPKGVVVRNLAFYIAPQLDPSVFNPATGTYASTEQPRVTIVLVLESITERVGERSIVSIQTTVTNRLYRR